MRVPNILQGASLLDELNRIRSDIDKHANEIATGKRVRVPSDDPIAAARATRTQTRLDAIEEYRFATETASGELLVVDDILNSLELLMDTAASAAAAGRSGTTSPEAFDVLANEVDGLREEVLRLSNSQYEGRFLFAGRQTLAPAFAQTAGVVSYQGDVVAPTARVGAQSVVETTIPGSDLFVGALDVFQVLGDLRDGLAAGDTAAVATEAANLEQIATRITSYRARVGHTLEELDRHSLRLSGQNIEEQRALSRDIDADLVESISRLNLQNTALQATLGTGARLMSISLLDLLG
jgi:flagellar hook-associated protein 3 FlgL